MSHYQTNGKALSQTAIYQQKLKRGVYTSPSVASIGVDSSASDTAALLAATSDLTVKPTYERVVAKEAQTAALAARQNNVKAWSRDNTDVYADAAALASVRTNTLSSVSSTSSGPLGVPSYNSGTLFKSATANSTYSLSSRTNPEKDVMRSGINSKNTGNNSLNIGKITQVAKENSTKSLNSRFNPELDYRSGLPGAAAAAALKENDFKHGSGYTNEVSSQRRTSTMAAIDFVDARLMAAANANAQERLKSISTSSNVDFKQQAIQYASALAIAQKNSDERVKQNKLGLIDLGGGATILSSELNALASQIVAPVLADIGVKANAQRGLDQEAKERQVELTKLHARHKQEQVEAKAVEKAELEEAKRQRGVENEERKKEQDEILEQHKTERAAVLTTKKEEFEALKVEQAAAREVLIKENTDNTARILEEETALKKERKDELDTLQAEKDELIRPTLEELAEETSKLTTLTNTHDQLAEEVAAAEKLNTDYELKIKELEELLESTKTEIETFTRDLEEATTTHETTSKDLAELETVAAEEAKTYEETNTELEHKLSELAAQHAAFLTEKSTKKETIFSELEDQVKDEHKINAELPEHLQSEVNEKKIKDTGSLFSQEPVEPVIEDVVPPKVAEAPAQLLVTPNKVKEKKPSSLRKLRSIFSSKKKEPKLKDVPKAKEKVVSKPIESLKSVKSSKSVKSEVSTASPDVKPVVSKLPSEYTDLASLSTGADKNQGGVFKEDI